MKKLFAILLAVMMIAALAVPAFADTTVTINPAIPEGAAEGTTAPTYTYYVMMKASTVITTSGANGGNGATAYYVEDQTKATALDNLKVGEDDLFTVAKAAGADEWYITINTKEDGTAFTGEEVAAALSTIKENAIATGEVAKTGDMANKISLGYNAYILIESSLGTKFIVDTYVTDTVKEKNFYPSVSKTLAENETANAEIGQSKTFVIPVVIPATVAEKAITVYDYMSAGLTMNLAITADNDVTGLAWTKGDTDANGVTTYSVEIPAATVKSLAGKTLKLTYTATVNEKAVVNVPETNKAGISYDNYTSAVTTPVEIKTYGFELVKVDGTTNAALQGVKFTLTNAAGEYYTPASNAESFDEDRFPADKTKVEVATDAAGKISFEGLAAGTYTLTETETKTGYNLLASAITVTVAENGTVTAAMGDTSLTVTPAQDAVAADPVNGTAGSAATLATFTVQNFAGSVLPSTGGIGTTIFYVVGGLMVMAAGVILVTKARVRREEN